MSAFWIAVVIGVAVGVVYVALAVQAFFRVRRDVLASAELGVAAEIDTAGLEEDHGTFAWKALGAVAASTAVIVLLGVGPVFWYLPAVLAIGSAAAVATAFIIDRRVQP
ncbi:hypothetical protein [Mycobacterium sp. ZZG]